jgi:hypothetical protein
MRGGRRVVGSRLGWVWPRAPGWRLRRPPAERRVETKLYDSHPDLAGRDTTPPVRRGSHRSRTRRRFGGSEGSRRRAKPTSISASAFTCGACCTKPAPTYLTRASDRDLLPAGSDAVRDDLAARVAAIDSLRPDVFLSLHHNSNAALDRERNAIETYYKLGDDGPSFDLGRAIHSQLGSHLGIETAKLLPGNYFVLRGAHTAAVLGEASYLSNPKVETKLQLADKQRLEAEAYFLGLLDYFVHGAAGDRQARAGRRHVANRRSAALRDRRARRPALGAGSWPTASRSPAGSTPRPATSSSMRRRTRAARLERRSAAGAGQRGAPWIGRLVVAAPPARAVWRSSRPRCGREPHASASDAARRERPADR